MGNPAVNTAMCQCSFGAAPAPLTVTSQTTVASATAAAMGVLTPMPCIPACAAPWAPGSPTVLVCNKPALNNSSKCMCNWGGVISVVMTPAVTINIP